MKKFFFIIILLIQFLGTAQVPDYIPGPVGYGLNDAVNNRAMIPLITKENYLICWTAKQEGAIQRIYLTKVNLLSNETTIYPYANFAAYTTGFRPRNFTIIENDIYFLCGTRLFKLNFLTDVVTELATFCDSYYVFNNYLIYNYNSTSSFVKNLTTGTILPLTGGGGDPMGFYEHNNELYWRSSVKRVVKFAPPNQTIQLYTNSVSTSLNESLYTPVTQFNNNLIYAVAVGSTFKLISINTSTNTVNPNFTFDTGTAFDPSVKDSFILNGILYLVNSTGLYTSDGVNAPVLTNIPFTPAHARLFLYNNDVYGVVSSPPFGYEIWKTNGSFEGTTMLKDINIGTDGINSSGVGSVLLNNTIFFSLRYYDSSESLIYNIYNSDGEEQNTVPILSADYFSNIESMLAHDNHLYIYGETSSEAGLFKIDVTEYSLAAKDNTISPNSFYPNPTNEKIFFKEFKSKIVFYSLNGIKVMESENIMQVDITNLPIGIYLMVTTNENGSTSASKIIRN